jgi:hypothetical protein
MSKTITRFWAGLLVLTASNFICLGMSIKPVNIMEMVEFSDRVFYGKCLSAESKFDPVSGVNVREYRFRVLEALKGVNDEEEIVIRHIETMGSKGASIPGIPSYRKGQELLLFLHADSRLGLTSPVGMSQGTFRPRKLENGEIGFQNPQGNQNLALRIQGTSPAARALSREQLDLLESGQPVPLNMFRDMVELLDELHEKQQGVIK